MIRLFIKECYTLYMVVEHWRQIVEDGCVQIVNETAQ